MTDYEAIKPYDKDNSEQLHMLYAQYGKAIYMAQLLEQQAINMLAIDDIVKSKPESPEAYDAIWAKYDHSKKMEGIMTTLLQDAYLIDEDTMQELREVLTWRNDLANRYFRFNNILFSTPDGRKRMMKDFTDFAGSITSVHDKLTVYTAKYHNKAGINAERITQLIAERNEGWKDQVIDETYDNSLNPHT